MPRVVKGQEWKVRKGPNMNIELLMNRMPSDGPLMLKAHRTPAPGLPLRLDPVLVFAAETAPVTYEIETIRHLGRDVALCPDLRRFNNLVGSPSRAWSLLFIEIEGFGGITSVLEKLRILRLERPDLPVVMASTRMRVHDLSVERLPVCDVSLALPADAADVNVALQKARVNNFAWQMRQMNMVEGEVAVPDQPPLLAQGA